MMPTPVLGGEHTPVISNLRQATARYSSVRVLHAEFLKGLLRVDAPAAFGGAGFEFVPLAEGSPDFSLEITTFSGKLQSRMRSSLPVQVTCSAPDCQATHTPSPFAGHVAVFVWNMAVVGK